MKHCLCLFLCMAVKEYYGIEQERSKVMTVQMDNLRGLLGIRRMDRVLIRDKGVMWSDEGSR